MLVLLMLKYFCITLLRLAISTQKTLLILAWNIIAWACAVTDRLVSSGFLPQPPPGLGVRMRLSCCTGNGGQGKVPAHVWALREAAWQGQCASGRLVLRTKGQKSLSPARSPRPLSQQLLPRQPGPWWLWDCHCPPRWTCTMGFSSSDWSGKSPAACRVPSASSCQCFPACAGLAFVVSLNKGRL